MADYRNIGLEIQLSLGQLVVVQYLERLVPG